MDTVWRRLIEPPPYLSPQWVQIVKIAFGSGIAWYLGSLVNAHLGDVAATGRGPIFAVLAVIISVQGHTYGSLLRAGQFVMGIVGGLVLGILVIRGPGLSPPVVALLVLVALGLGTRIRVGPDLNLQIAISALLILALGSVNYGIVRLIETLIGGVIGVGISTLLWPPDPLRMLNKGIREGSTNLTRDLVRTVEILGADSGAVDNLDSVREHNGQAAALIAQVMEAERALRWNPVHAAGRGQLEQLEDRVRLLAQTYRHVRSLARLAADLERVEDNPSWLAARSELELTASTLSQAIEQRIVGGDPLPALSGASRHRDAFARLSGQFGAAGAIVVELDELLVDLSGPPQPTTLPSPRGPLRVVGDWLAGLRGEASPQIR